MDEEKIYLDKEGYEQYLNKIEKLKDQLKNNSKLKSSAHTSAIGDGWHDNFPFEEAKRLEGMIIKELERKYAGLKRIVVVENTNNIDVVNINDIVRLHLDFGDNDIEEGLYRLIGGTSPNVIDDIQEITLNSKLGSSIYNKKINTKTNYIVNGNTVNVDILEKIEKKK